MSDLIPVMTKTIKRFGTVYPSTATEYSVEFVREGKNITGIKIYKNGELKNTFNVGDRAEYDSFNLSYIGTIEAISEKCVTIWTGWYRHPHGSSSKESNKKELRRLNLNEFCWRNYNFDLITAIEKNNEERLYL